MGEIKEINITDLAKDESFLDDIREGNFVLVLGAGFSYGIASKNIECKTIPTAEQFIRFTNEKFVTTVTSYEAAASVWERKIKDNSELMDGFRNLFLVDESKFDFDLFRSFFIPNWYNVFTFNFDNVLEVIQNRSLTKRYPIFAYPNDSKDNNESCILHLHGLVNEVSELNDIVFTSTSYTKLGNEKHDLYDVLHGDVNTNKKNLVIVGTQFNERIVFSKFFDGLEREDIKIFHFVLKNDDVREKEEFYNRDYTFVKLDDKKGNIGTKFFYSFSATINTKFEKSNWMVQLLSINVFLMK